MGCSWTSRQVAAGEPVRVDMGFVNVIWQGDANAQAIRALTVCLAATRDQRHRSGAPVRARNRGRLGGC
jgi:hypothetical protein